MNRVARLARLARIVITGLAAEAPAQLGLAAASPRPCFFPLTNPWRTFASRIMTTPEVYNLPEQWSEELKDENGEPMSKR